MNAKLLKLSHIQTRYLLVFDLLTLVLTPALSMYIRMEEPQALLSFVYPLAVYAIFMACLKLLIYIKAGLYTRFWAYASSEELATLLLATGLGFAAEILVFFFVLIPTGVIPKGFPHSVSVINGLLTTVMISGSRMAMRLVYGLSTRGGNREGLKQVLIAGAGVAGTLMAKELQANLQLGLVPMGYVDDNPTKIGKMIHGVRVQGPLKDLAEVVKRNHVDQVIVAMPTASGEVVRNIHRLCREAGVKSKTVPGLFEMLSGSARIQQIRNIEIEDLLRRGAIKTNTAQVGELLKSARVLITGAGGSIGGELCRQIKTFSPAEMVLVGHGENSIFKIEKELRIQKVPGLAIQSVIADIRDRDRMEQVFKKYQPQVVFHAAAHKHVGLMENNLADAVTNNVLGTKILVGLAEKYAADRFVLISSDKAVNPTSIMGVTKRIAELVVKEADAGSGCAFVTVRFGNVLGSRGSVVPIFRQQIEMGGPVTVTHPEVRRYFMTIPEAVQLVLQAGAMGSGGEVFILDMGEQIKVADIARELIRLSGFEEGKDISIEYTGLLPGEKMFEELFYENERAEATLQEKVLVHRNGSADAGALDEHVHPQAHHDRPTSVEADTLVAAVRQGDLELVGRLFKKLVPQYAPSSSKQPVTAQEKPLDKHITINQATSRVS